MGIDNLDLGHNTFVHQKTRLLKMNNSQEFEQLISRIHKLLSDNKTEVTWDATVPDPDNECQKRQVDILIKREDIVTHVECRSHNKPQDVKC